MDKNYIIQSLKKQIEDFESEISAVKTGVVLEVGDGIAKISGLSDIKMSEMVEFENGIFGVVLNLEQDRVGVIILGDYEKIKEGDIAKSTGKILEVPVGDALIGRIVNALGEPIDGKGEIFAESPLRSQSEASESASGGKTGKFYPVEKIAPGVISREPVNMPLQTGIKAIDSMIPIGRGQRELIIGDRQSGKSALVIDAIINQKSEPEESRPICVYVAVGQKESKTAKIAAKLKEKGAMDYTIMVVASASDSASLQYIAPYTGTAMGEYFMDKGKDVLVIYDDLSKHAWAYRQISLLLRRPPGREAYPGDIFYLHSRLLERACKLNKKYGGGSLTSLPIVETQAGDVTAYIPTNIISITDGQIYLEPELFYAGIRPAINIGLSVSRVGSAAQTKIMKQIAGRLRLELAQYYELKAFAQFGAELDRQTQEKIEKGKRMVEILKQQDLSPMPFEEQSAIIYAGIYGFLDDIKIEYIRDFEQKLLDSLKLEHKNILEKISETKKLTEDIDNGLRMSIKEFKETIPQEWRV